MPPGTTTYNQTPARGAGEGFVGKDENAVDCHDAMVKQAWWINAWHMLLVTSTALVKPTLMITNTATYTTLHSQSPPPTTTVSPSRV